MKLKHTKEGYVVSTDSKKYFRALIQSGRFEEVKDEPKEEAPKKRGRKSKPKTDE